MLDDLLGRNNKFFQNFKSKVKINQKQLKYFTYEYKKAANLGKIYLLPKINKILWNVLGRSVISNCVKPTDKASAFLGYQLKSVMQKGKSYIKDSEDFINKIKNIEKIREGSTLVTADVVGLEDLNNYHPNVSPMNQLKNFSPFYTCWLVCQILYRPVYKTYIQAPVPGLFLVTPWLYQKVDYLLKP